MSNVRIVRTESIIKQDFIARLEWIELLQAVHSLTSVLFFSML